MSYNYDNMDEMLKKLGLGDYEARIYAILAEESPASATHIAKKAGLSRSSVYTTLSSLTSRGLVGTSYKNEVKQFVAEGHDALSHMLSEEKKTLDEKFKTLSKIETALKENLSSPLGVPRIMFFEGKESLKKIYRSMLWEMPENSTMYIIRDEFVWNKDWQFIFEKEWHDSVKNTRADKNIKTKLLINNSPIEKKKESFYKKRKGLEYRHLAAKNSVSEFALYVTEKEASILSFEHNNLVGIRISNKNIANNFIKLFTELWEK